MINKIKIFYLEISKSNFVQNVALTFSNRIILLLIGLGTSIAIARYLGPEGRGMYAVASLFIGLGVQFGNLGLHASNTYEVSKNPDSLPFLIGNSLVIGISVGLILIIVAIGIEYSFPSLISIKQNVWIITLLVIPFSLAYLLFQNILLGINKIAEFNKIELYSKVLLTFLIISFLLFNYRNAESVLLAMLISVVYSFAKIFYYLKSISKVQISIKHFTNQISYGLKAYFAALFAFLQQKITLYFVSQFSGVLEAGYFSISITLFDLILIFPITIGSLFFPKISGMSNEMTKWKLTRKVLIIIMISMSFVILCLQPLTPTLINLLYGQKYINSITPFVYLLPGVLFMSISMIVMNYLGSCGNPIVVVITPLISLFFILSSIYFFKDNFNSITAAKVNSISYFISMVVVLIYFYYKKLKVENS